MDQRYHDAMDVAAELKKLLDRPDRNEWTDTDAAEVLSTAIEAVLALHVQVRSHCSNCSQRWPCDTVEAIRAKLEPA
jgi:antitoxin component HigA of HigAB toxin-antitoxin module